MSSDNRDIVRINSYDDTRFSQNRKTTPIGEGLFYRMQI